MVGWHGCRRERERGRARECMFLFFLSFFVCDSNVGYGMVWQHRRPTEEQHSTAHAESYKEHVTRVSLEVVPIPHCQAQCHCRTLLCWLPQRNTFLSPPLSWSLHHFHTLTSRPTSILQPSYCYCCYYYYCILHLLP